MACAGLYSCYDGWAGSVTRSLMLRGFDALVDCNGTGGAFKVGNSQGSQIKHVIISGFQVQNAVGSSSNNGYAGGVDVRNTNDVSVLSSRFLNCSGREAGAIAVFEKASRGNKRNKRTLQELEIRDCSGGESNPRVGAGAAGSISISYYSASGSNNNNIQTLSGILVSGSNGGTKSSSGAAGSISISYNSKSDNNNNVHTISNLIVSDSRGGTGTKYGGNAGSLSVSYYTDGGSNNRNTHALSNLQITNSVGGYTSKYGGSAGSLSLSFHSRKGNAHNRHLLSNLRIRESRGGVGSQFGGGAGAVSISYYNERNVAASYNSNNVLELSNSQISGSNGGRGAFGGAGGVHVGYNFGKSVNNTHTISNTSFDHCIGGDPTQGAGALAVQSLAITSGLNVSILNSVFAANQAGSQTNRISPQTGVAGAVRIYTKDSVSNTQNSAQIIGSYFESNAMSCTSGLCMAGAVAVSVPTRINRCVFKQNSSPRGTGALYADMPVDLTNSVFTNNTVTQSFSGCANVGRFSAANTTMHFSGSNGGILFNNITSHEQLKLTCPAGSEVVSSVGQFTCQNCPSEYKTLS